MCDTSPFSVAWHRFSEGEGGLQLWRATAIVFNMQSRTGNEGGPSARDPGELLTIQNKEICSFWVMIWKFALCGYDSLNFWNFGNRAHMRTV